MNAYRYLSTQQREFVLSKQLLRSGTAIGALVRESEYAETKPDFIHKLAIARKEANETLYWLELLEKTCFITPNPSRQPARKCYQVTEAPNQLHQNRQRKPIKNLVISH